MKFKQLVNLLRFKMGYIQPSCGPAKAQWELTYSCNLKCKHCQIWRIPQKEIEETTLSLDKQKAIVDDLADNGVTTISFSGGEMFLQKTVYELIAHAKRRGVHVLGNTNAFAINKANAKKIVDSGIDILSISLDGDNAKTHDAIRGVEGAFDKVFEGVANILELKPDFEIAFNVVINKNNYNQLVGIAKLAREAKAHHITVEMTNTFDKYSPNTELILPDEKFGEFQEQIDELFRDYRDLLIHTRGYFDEFETYVKNPSQLYKYRCLAGFSSAQIHPNGDLFPCPVAFKKMGNLAENKFSDLWFSKDSDDLRQDIKEGRHPICWVTCVSPANQMLSYVSPSGIYKLLRQPGAIWHALKKI